MNLLRKLALAALSTVVCLGALEGVARLTEGVLPPQEAILPSPRGAACADCAPGTASAASSAPPVRLTWSARTDTWMAVAPEAPYRPDLPEIRGPAPAEPRPDGQIRLMTLGDSSVWGHGVGEDAVFSARAAQQVRAATGADLVAFNAAQPGHILAQSQRTLRTLAPVVRPDVVLIANLWSDLFHPEAPARLVGPGAESPSALYRMLLRALAPALPPRAVSWIDPETGRGMPAQGRSAQTPLADYRRQLRAVAQDVERMGARPAFLLLPAFLDVQSAVPPVIAAYRQAMIEAARDHQAILIDGAAAFRAAEADASWFLDAVHPSDRGHETLGEALAASILQAPEAWGMAAGR